MNRKHNPWAALIALVLLAIIIISTCTSCGFDRAAEAEKIDAHRFTVKEFDTDLDIPAYGVQIITDTETGVQYLVVYSSRGPGVTVLQTAQDKEAED